MAIVILLSLLTLALLVLLVLGLHRYQLSVAQSNADKHDPLPPLNNVTLDPNLPDFSLEDDLLEAEADLAQPKQYMPGTHSASLSSDDSADETTKITAPRQAAGLVKPATTRESPVQSFAAPLREGDAVQQAPLPLDEHRTEVNPLPERARLLPDSPIEAFSDTELPPDEAATEVSQSGSSGHGDWPTRIESPPVAKTEAHWPEATMPPPPASSAPDQDTLIETPSVTEDASVESQQEDEPDQEPTQVPQHDRGGNASAGNSTAHVDEAITPPSVQAPRSDASQLEDLEHWQEQVAELKKQESLDAALQVCEQEFPLWSAYQQASLIHRARIKQLAQDGKSIGSELKALYRLAAQASFLHDRVKGLPNLPLSQLKKVDLDEVAGLEMPYDKIGYNELRLIKKTDIKLLLENWGKPQAHIKPRELHADTWKRLIARRQTTLF